MDAQVFLEVVIRPALLAIGLHSAAAEELLLGTALVESQLVHREQLAGGPALGLFQMEPRTHDDIWRHYLRYRTKLARKVDALLSRPGADRPAELLAHERYAAAMVRIHYKRVAEALPSAGDTAGMTRYWKRYYNTRRGKGREAKYAEAWGRGTARLVARPSSSARYDPEYGPTHRSS